MWLETALSASRKVQIETPKRADFVLLAVLRDYGCTNAHISGLIKHPNLLTADPAKNLLPKLKFFHSVGFYGPDIESIVVSNHIIPSYNFLKSVVMTNGDIMRSFKKTFWISSQNVQPDIAPNIQTLKGIGVPVSNIKYLLTCHPPVVSHGKERFSRIVKNVLDMGFDPVKIGFLKAMYVSCQFSGSLFQHKMEVYGGFGFTDDGNVYVQIGSLLYGEIREENQEMKFLVSEMGWEPANIARYPTVFLRSLEKNIIPRCCIESSSNKGVGERALSLTSLCFSEQIFLDMYVLKYEQEIPRLLNLYQGKIHTMELDFVSEWVRQKKQL